ncbi:MAG: SusC/RagA family TonB-linked outer membrane protein [Flavisolibacter sp.]
MKSAFICQYYQFLSVYQPKRKQGSKMVFSFFVSLIFFHFAFAQRTIGGKVLDETGFPLQGATVSAANGKTAVKSNAAGEFSIQLPLPDTLLSVSFVGFQTKVVSVQNKNNITITLTAQAATLGQVVVVGYGTQNRKDVTGAIGSVKGEAIKNLPVQNVAEALQGRVAGVEVTKSSGEPGTSAQITIRGVSSLNQPNPLYIIDGVRGSGDNINPQDIATIDVLKDASAASIYGAAAAGGVIIITTKKGQGPSPILNFSGRYGITTPNILQLLNKDEFIALKKLTRDPYYVNNNQTDTFPNTNWVDAIFRNGLEKDYNLSVSGSAPAVNYFVSGVHNYQQGVYLNNNSTFDGFRVNTDIKINSRIKIGEQIYGWQRNTAPVDYGTPLGSATSPRLNPPFRTVPTMYIYGAPGEWGKNPPGFSGPNIVGQIRTKNRSDKQMNVQSNLYVEVKLPWDLSFRTTLGYTVFNEEGNDFQGVLRTDVDAVVKKGLSKSFVSYRNLLNASTLAFDHAFHAHMINALIGYEQYRGTYNALYTNETDVGGSNYAYLPTSGTTFNIANGGYDPFPLVKSIFGRINYAYHNRYLLSVSARRDADFIKFGPGKQHGVFPAISAGWKISEEGFFKKLLPALTQLKLRGSYGVVGNSQIPAYRFLSAFDVISAQNFSPGGQPILNYTQTNLSNSNIKWESVYETNLGLDGEVGNGKLYFTVDWYNKTTKDLLYKLPIPLSVGISDFYTNIGSVNNTGMDFSLGYRSALHALTYNIGVTGSFNQNKVLDLDGVNTNPIRTGNNNYGDANATQGVMVGQALTFTKAGLPFGQFYGYKVTGIYKTADEINKHPQQPGKQAHIGDLIFQDTNGDGIINDLDRTIIGNPYPKFSFGANINLTWKGFDLALLFNGVTGVDLFNGVAPYAASVWSDGNTTRKVFMASYLGSNGLTAQPRIGVLSPDGTSYTPDPNGNYTLANSYFVEDGSYVKLKNVQLGYSFSNKLLGRAHIKSARVYLMGNNLLTLTRYTGVDPELGSQDLSVNGGTTSRGIDGPYKYPSVKIYSLGVNLTF